MSSSAYRYLDDVATADIAFEAEGDSLEEVFVAAAEATMNVMIEDLSALSPSQGRTIDLKNTELDMLLFDLLQELIYYKDAEQLLLRITDISVAEREGAYLLRARAAGEKLDLHRHEQRVDVKAVTLHRFSLKRTGDGWKAFVILDV